MKDQVRRPTVSGELKFLRIFAENKPIAMLVTILKELFGGKPFYLETYDHSTVYYQNELYAQKIPLFLVPQKL